MKTNLVQDVVPITDLMHAAKNLIARLRKNKRPILVTQNGRAAFVCQDVQEYQSQMRKLEMIDAILMGEKDFSSGRFSEWSAFEKTFDKL